MLALAESEGWKRCPGCGHLVELSVGCYHMTCRCRYQFCYLCRAQWKTCACEQWDENRLLVAAEDRVQRRQAQAPANVNANPEPRRNAPAPMFRQLVEREAERLRTNHDCTHRWQYVARPGRCEGCGDYLRIFLYVSAIVSDLCVTHC